MTSRSRTRGQPRAGTGSRPRRQCATPSMTRFRATFPAALWRPSVIRLSCTEAAAGRGWERPATTVGGSAGCSRGCCHHRRSSGACQSCHFSSPAKDVVCEARVTEGARRYTSGGAASWIRVRRAAILPRCFPSQYRGRSRLSQLQCGSIDTSGDAATLLVAHQAAAIVHRDAGAHRGVASARFAALRLARGVSRLRQADVMATLGVVLACMQAAPRRPASVRRGQGADPAGGPAPATAAPRTSWPWSAGNERHAPISPRPSWAAAPVGTSCGRRCTEQPVVVSIALGLVDDAEEDARLAERLFDSLGQEFEATEVLHNRAATEMLRGDLPRALELSIGPPTVTPPSAGPIPGSTSIASRPSSPPDSTTRRRRWLAGHRLARTSHR